MQVIHYRLMQALYAKSTPFAELEQIWALVEYVESVMYNMVVHNWYD